jgi:hypothetical protein
VGHHGRKLKIDLQMRVHSPQHFFTESTQLMCMSVLNQSIRSNQTAFNVALIGCS